VPDTVKGFHVSIYLGNFFYYFSGTPCIDKMNMPDPDTLEYMKRLFEESNNKENLGNRALVKDILSTPVKNFVREGKRFHHEIEMHLMKRIKF
jgi:hypothetical protein